MSEATHLLHNHPKASLKYHTGSGTAAFPSAQFYRKNHIRIHYDGSLFTVNILLNI